MNIGYKRVSTKDQSTDRQLHGIALDMPPFVDYITGSTMDRPELAICLRSLRDGDILHVHSVDRLARKLVDALEIIKQVLAANATIIIYSPYLRFSGDKSDPYAMFQLSLFASIAELERSMMHERQREGIARVKATGTKSGKPFGKTPLDLSLAPKVLSLHRQGMSNRMIALELKLSRPSIAKLLTHATQAI